MGTKLNPVGYSGLLALKALKNQIVAELDQTSFQIKNHKKILELLSCEKITDDLWQFDTSISQYLKIYAPILEGDPQVSLEVKSQLAVAKASQQKINAERAKYLPKVGLFAQDSLYTGERG